MDCPPETAYVMYIIYMYISCMISFTLVFTQECFINDLQECSELDLKKKLIRLNDVKDRPSF